jgi:hypothetical protein
MLKHTWVLALVLSACSSDKTQANPDASAQADGPPSVDGAPAAAPSLTFGLTEQDVLAGTTAPATYDVLTVNDIWVDYTIAQTALPDPAVLRIETVMPSGLPFRDYIVGFARDPRQTPQVYPADLSMPISTGPTHPNGDQTSLTYGMAIAGTDYVRHSMPGTWRVKASVDGVAGGAIERTIELRVGP